MAKIEERVVARYKGAGDLQADAKAVLALFKKNFRSIEVEAKPSSRDVIFEIRVNGAIFDPKVVEFGKALGVRDIEKLLR